MAFPEDDFYQQQQQRTSPKLFTEYSLSAILVIVGLIGSFLTTSTLSIATIVISWVLIMTSTLDSILSLTLIFSLAMFPLGIYQLYHAHQLHKKSFHNFTRMQTIAGLNVMFSVVQAAIYASVQFIIGLMMLYAFSSVIVFNLIVVYLLNQSNVRSEFEERVAI